MDEITYLLPLRAERPPSRELTSYLHEVARGCAVVVVDSSPEPVLAANAAAWSTFARHLRPDPGYRCANGKVHNVRSGLDHVTTPVVVIADDDVRYDPASLRAVVEAMASADLVVPQNVFVPDDGGPLPWHAVWDTARILLNRTTGGDFPGTLVVRTEILRRTEGYDGDVLFENLELMRTVIAAGGRVSRLDGVYVPRRPPTAGHFGGQRIRQAYDEFARPRRLLLQLAIAPSTVLAARRHPLAPIALAALAVGFAEAGRRRHGGRAHFPRRASLLAPAWLLERGCCAWLALAARARGGARYAGGRLRTSANSVETIRRRLDGRSRDVDRRAPLDAFGASIATPRPPEAVTLAR